MHVKFGKKFKLIRYKKSSKLQLWCLLKVVLVVDAGVRAFVPASMVSDHYVDNLAQFKGQTLAFEIVEIEPSENRLILSRKT